MGLMEGLTGWLRQIVAVILLASLIDLLLPNRTMQRYVRLVAGLFILTTVAMPIMQWIKGDVDGKLAAGLQAVERAPGDADAQLARIEAEGAKLREGHLAQAERLVSAKLEAEIRGELERSGHEGVRDVAVSLGRGKDGEWAAAKVVVELAPAGSGQDPGGGESSRIREVEDVNVVVRVGELSIANPRAIPAAAGGEPPESADRETAARISALLAGRFGISAEVVEVVLAAPEDEAFEN
ncbi:stage III sporulation protein AF [Paenibacillaceae bacterium WGS1546]|uniref:stage III sporulation protein AF n=1 Tax=Cohnella sp. WGS1546 TaxID=3366810 RepID=UPI00372D708C